MKSIIVLGAGMVGSAIAIDLAKKHSVSISDFNKNALEMVVSKCKKITSIPLDVTNKTALQKIIKPYV